MALSRRLVAEGVGTALLVTAVVGSGIMAHRLAGGDVALALLANTVATAATLVALILALGPIPAVTIARAFTDTFAGIRPSDVPAFIAARIAGALAATALTTWLLGGERSEPVAIRLQPSEE